MEGDAGTRQLNPTDAEDAPDESVAVSEQEQTSHRARTARRRGRRAADDATVAAAARPRLGRRDLRRLLVLAAAGGGRRLSRADRHNRRRGHRRADEAAALQAAKECVAATQAPDTAAMRASQSKIIECSTGDFGAQASLYSGVLVEAYQAANVKVQVSDMRAAVERHNDDGSVDVLVAVRVKVTNSEAADQEQGYRLRVHDGAGPTAQYKIAKLDQVTS